MSKIEDLKGKYPKINVRVFDYFVDNDITKTNKYLDYMLKIWNSKYSYTFPISKSLLLEIVTRFHNLLPYIENKDIYNSMYDNFTVLSRVVNAAQEIKNEKTFVKNDHITIINETKTYLLIALKTHQGSLKYGAGTRWCTASIGSPSTFNSYNSNFLLYLIDKTGNRKKSYEKIAFYSQYIDECHGYNIFNAADNSVSNTDLISYGWTEEELYEISFYFNIYRSRKGEFDKALKTIKKTTAMFDKFDFVKFKEAMVLVNPDYSPDVTKLQENLLRFSMELTSLYKLETKNEPVNNELVK